MGGKNLNAAVPKNTANVFQNGLLIINEQHGFSHTPPLPLCLLISR
jgi:hypothetical protein